VEFGIINRLQQFT